MRNSNIKSSSPSLMRKKDNSGRNLAIGGALIIGTVGSVVFINDKIDDYAERQNIQMQLKNDARFAKNQIMSLDRRFLSDFKEVASTNVSDYVISYWGVDRFGDRALVVVFSNGYNPKLTVLKFAASSLPELNGLSPYMEEFVNMKDKTKSVIYSKIMSGRLKHSTEHGFVDKKELGHSLSYHTDNYANGNGSYNSALMYLLMSNSNYYNASPTRTHTVKELNSNRSAFSKSESRSGAYTGGSGGGGIAHIGGRSGYSGKSTAIGARAGFGHGG